MPCFTRVKFPGLTRSATLAAFSGVMRSPGFTGSSAGPAARAVSGISDASNDPSQEIDRRVDLLTAEILDDFLECAAIFLAADRKVECQPVHSGEAFFHDRRDIGVCANCGECIN